MPNVTVTTADVFFDETWDPELNRAIEFDTVIMGLFTDKSKMQKTGNLYHLGARHNLTANTKSASSEATPESITETEQTFNANTHQIVAQEIEDIVEVISKYSIRAEYTAAASYALARAMDVSAAALLDDNTTQTVGTLTAELSDDNMLSAWQFLMNASAKPPFKGVVSAACWTGFLKIDKFINALYNGDTKGKALHEAQIGTVYNSTFYTSQLTVGTAPNSSGHLWASDHFFKIIRKPAKQDGWFSPLAKAFIVATDTIYGVFEKQEADEAAAVTTTARLWGVRLQTLK